MQTRHAATRRGTSVPSSSDQSPRLTPTARASRPHPALLALCACLGADALPRAVRVVPAQRVCAGLRPLWQVAVVFLSAEALVPASAVVARAEVVRGPMGGLRADHRGLRFRRLLLLADG